MCAFCYIVYILSKICFIIKFPPNHTADEGVSVSEDDNAIIVPAVGGAIGAMVLSLGIAATICFVFWLFRCRREQQDLSVVQEGKL